VIWVLILASWEAAYRLFAWPPWTFPAPSHIVDGALALLNVDSGFGEAIGPGWPHLGWARRLGVGIPLLEAPLISCVRLAAGFALSVLLGGALGLAMWRWAALNEFLGPLFLGLQTLPSVCWVPVAILLLGINESAILFVLVMGSFFAVAIALRDGLRTIPPLYQRAGLMLGARGWRLYRYVLLPASLPALASSLRQGFAFAWRSLMGAEFIFMIDRHGLGFLLQTGRDFNDIAQVFAVLAVMVILSMLADRLIFARLERRVHARFGLAR
jgi:NitT/TauT family transport system permease protein